MYGGVGVGVGLELRWVGGLWATSSDIYGLGVAIAITPQAGESVTNVFFDQYSLDTSTYEGLFIAPAGGGKADSVYFNNSWISYNGRYNSNAGAFIDATGGEVYDFAFNAGRIVTNGGSGIQFNGSVANIHLADNEIGANSLTVPGTTYGVILGLAVSDAHILNNRIGQPVLNPTGTTQQTRGLFAYGADYMEIRGNTFLGDIGAIDYGSSGTHNVIKDNPGYNPSGSFPITVTASPFTYTAGPVPEVVYISGTITSATRNSYGACPALTAGTCTVILPPNGAVVVTYASTAPTMVKDIQ
jgi:hypothetical protein